MTHRSALLVAYHFPPLAGSSGVQRALRLTQHLPALGWAPLVLTASTGAYERTSDDLMRDVPAGTVVERALALDASRQLAIGGRYVAATARPDRWASWRFDAVRRGLRLIRQHRPSVIWSTYPIATAHRVGSTLSRLSGLPWVADFRDPMAQDGYPADPLTHAQFVSIERDAMQRASVCSFTTPGAATEYRQRYPDASAAVEVIENGYDEATFDGLEAEARSAGPLTPGASTWLHSGIVYGSERDPTQLMAALRLLHDAGRVSPTRLRVRFRAAVEDDLLRRLADAHGVGAYIETLPAIPYRAALVEMLRADALVVMQAANCNAQIPAKVYEYFRAGRPILGLTPHEGDTGMLLRRMGVPWVAPLDSAADMATAMRALLDAQRGQVALGVDATLARTASRQARSEQFARIFDQVAREPAPALPARRASR